MAMESATEQFPNLLPLCDTRGVRLGQVLGGGLLVFAQLYRPILLLGSFRDYSIACTGR